VAKVYPELVVRDDQGRIDGVRYDELAPMLLNEVQKQLRKFAISSGNRDSLRSNQSERTEATVARRAGGVAGEGSTCRAR